MWLPTLVIAKCLLDTDEVLCCEKVSCNSNTIFGPQVPLCTTSLGLFCFIVVISDPCCWEIMQHASPVFDPWSLSSGDNCPFLNRWDNNDREAWCPEGRPSVCWSAYFRSHYVCAVSHRIGVLDLELNASVCKTVVLTYFELWGQKKNFCTFSSFHWDGLHISEMEKM